MSNLFKKIASIFKKKEKKDDSVLKEMALAMGRDDVQYATREEEVETVVVEPAVEEVVIVSTSTEPSHGGEIEKHIAVKKPTVKKTATKKTPAKKATTKKPAAKKATTAKKTATKKPVAKKAPAKKTTKK